MIYTQGITELLIDIPDKERLFLSILGIHLYDDVLTRKLYFVTAVYIVNILILHVALIVIWRLSG